MWNTKRVLLTKGRLWYKKEFDVGQDATLSFNYQIFFSNYDCGISVMKYESNTYYSIFRVRQVWKTAQILKMLERSEKIIGMSKHVQKKSLMNFGMTFTKVSLIFNFWGVGIGASTMKSVFFISDGGVHKDRFRYFRRCLWNYFNIFTVKLLACMY